MSALIQDASWFAANTDAANLRERRRVMKTNLSSIKQRLVSTGLAIAPAMVVLAEVATRRL
jgi:hypothetical protein